MEKIRGNQVLSGTWGEMWINGEKLVEFSKIETSVEFVREDVQIDQDIDTKQTGRKGEITVTVKKVFSSYNTVMGNYKSPKDVRAQIIAKLSDPDAVGGQQERWSFDNVWWNKLPLFIAEKGAIVEEEWSGGFTVSDSVCLDAIKR